VLFHRPRNQPDIPQVILVSCTTFTLFTAIYLHICLTTLPQHPSSTPSFTLPYQPNPAPLIFPLSIALYSYHPNPTHDNTCTPTVAGAATSGARSARLPPLPLQTSTAARRPCPAPARHEPTLQAETVVGAECDFLGRGQDRSDRWWLARPGHQGQSTASDRRVDRRSSLGPDSEGPAP
jgi:hypothetical protein